MRNSDYLIAMGGHAKLIQARMRHATIVTTMDTYGHLMAGAFQGMGERRGGPAGVAETRIRIAF